MKNFAFYSITIFLLFLLTGCPSGNNSKPDHEVRVEEVFSNRVELFIMDHRVAPGSDYTLCYKKKANICAMCATGPAGNCRGGINIQIPQGSNSVVWTQGGLDPNTKYRILVKNYNGVRIGKVVEFTTTR